MATLILSCNTGEGHNSCAKAIKEYYGTVGEECNIKDGLEFISPVVSHFISWGHSYVYRHLPWLFKWGYAHSEKHPAIFHDGSLIHKFMAQGTERMYEYIKNGQYDVVICTHVFTALMLTDVLKAHPMRLTTCFVATDYTCSPSVKDSNLDYYFIPDNELVTEFACKAIAEEKLIPSGIPVRQIFYISCAKKDAKVSMDVLPGHKHLIMMCGSMGCGPMKNLLHELAERISNDWELSVICGNNKKLYDKLSAKYKGNKRIHIRGFVKDMGTMMDSADLYLTKPGGISVTEAQAKALPMVLIDAVAGCEEYNYIHFIRKGGAKSGVTVNELVNVCLSLMQNDDERKRMKACLTTTEKRNSAQVIYNKMKSVAESLNDQFPA